MTSQNIYLESLTQAFTAMPLYLWALIVGALVFSLVLRILARVLQPKFTARPLLNKSETHLFKILQDTTPDGFYVFAQVSYGEFLCCASHRKFWTINAKRADFVICDSEFNAVAAIEYQGRGHFGKTHKSRRNTKKRDNAKFRALREANIPMVEIPPTFDRELIRDVLDFVYNPNTS